MKIIYSKLKEFLPSLEKSARGVADDLTMIGHFAEGVEKRNGQEVISLEIKQNRGDCLGYLGLAKDLSVLYQIPLTTFNRTLPQENSLPPATIKVAAGKEVERLIAAKITKINNSASPAWLKNFLELHEINSLNTLVDLTNYIMLLFGIPCHAFDSQKIGDGLIWEINNGQYKKMTTFDGTEILLEDNTFLIGNGRQALSLPFIGGENSGVDQKTKETIVEMAVYNRIKVRKDARKLKIVTEASIRLEKDLDTELIPQAFSHLIELIKKLCSGKVTSQFFDHYPQKPKRVAIEFDPQRPSAYAGISISENFAVETLKNLDCQLIQNKGAYLVYPPTLRKDLGLEEDLIEEIIRFYGYDKIPTNEPISSTKLPDITPKILYLIQAVRNILVKIGYDEVRSWPLIKEKDLVANEDLPPQAQPVYTQNSINSDYPVLRLSMISSLRNQRKQYQKYKVLPMQFFEIGKVFYQVGARYCEHFALGIYHQSAKQLKNDLEKLVATLGADGAQISIIKKIKNQAYGEVNLENLLKNISSLPVAKPTKTSPEATHELVGQIINLDANVTKSKKQDPEEFIKGYSQRIGEKYLWQLVITDVYQDPKTKDYKYTFRASYFNLDDKKAKKIHLKAFGLK